MRSDHLKTLRGTTPLLLAAILLFGNKNANASETDATLNPLSGIVLNLNDVRADNASNAAPPPKNIADYKFVMTAEYYLGFVHDVLPLQKPEHSKTDSKLVKQIKVAARKRDIISTDDLWRLFQLRVHEKHFSDADNCLKLIRMIATKTKEDANARSVLDKEEQQLRKQLALYRIEKSDWFKSHKKYSEAYQQLVLAELFFEGEPAERQTTKHIDEKFTALENLMPADCIDVSERRKRKLQTQSETNS